MYRFSFLCKTRLEEVYTITVAPRSGKKQNISGVGIF
jgi:hypothetical protein